MSRKRNTSIARTGRLCLLALALLAGAPAPAQETKKTTVGFELDALTYLSGGWYGSAWVGRDRVRIRPVVASTELPSFLVEEGFSDAKVEAYALVVDWFFRDGFQGFRVGAGAEYWKNCVTNEADEGDGGRRHEQPEALLARGLGEARLALLGARDNK